jgi:hypothetical protein
MSLCFVRLSGKGQNGFHVTIQRPYVRVVRARQKKVSEPLRSSLNCELNHLGKQEIPVPSLHSIALPDTLSSIPRNILQDGKFPVVFQVLISPFGRVKSILEVPKQNKHSY